MNESHRLVELARRTIEEWVTRRVKIDPPKPLEGEMARRAGAFVTIHKHGQLRGCIGTIQATHENVAQEVIENAIAAASCDPRFHAIEEYELEDLDVKVDVLGDPEPVEGVEDLDPKRYGLIVQSLRHPWKRGLLLPDLEGIDTAEKQLHWTRNHKAGITDPDEPVQLFRFQVKRYA